MGMQLGLVRSQRAGSRRIGLRMTLVPGLQSHKISAKAGLTDALEALFSHDQHCYLSTPNFKISLTSDANTGLITLTFNLGKKAVDDKCFVTKKASMMVVETADIWHRWMEHFNLAAVEILWKSPWNGLDYTRTFSNCGVCAFRKSRQQKRPKYANIRIDTPMELSYCDLFEPLAPKPQREYRYLFGRTDHVTRGKKMCLLRTKPDVKVAISRFNLDVAVPLDKRIIRLRACKEIEFTSKEFEISLRNSASDWRSPPWRHHSRLAS